MTIDISKTTSVEFIKGKAYPTYSLAEFMMGTPPQLVPTYFSTDLTSTTEVVIIENDGVNSKLLIPMKKTQPIICVAKNTDYKKL